MSANAISTDLSSEPLFTSSDDLLLVLIFISQNATIISVNVFVDYYLKQNSVQNFFHAT